MEEHVTKRRKLAPVDTTVHVPRIARRLHAGSAKVSVGDSSTLGFLSFVHQVSNSVTKQDLDGDWHVMLETQPGISANTVLPPISSDDVQSYAKSYLCFVHNIFDIFLDANLYQDLDRFSPSQPVDGSVVSICSLLLVLAIGAEQELMPGIGYVLFQSGYRRLNFLATPTLSHLQSQLLVVLYLLLKCRRDAAASHLGMAVSASHTLGLHETCSDPAAARAWKCLRILDVSTSASLGRPLSTSSNQSLKNEEQIHAVGLELCDIAETMLRGVYAAKKLSVEFALAVSVRLKEWAEGIPGVLVSGEDVSDIPLSQQLSANHMTAAYYWTIILLTRPFLMNDVLSRRSGKGTNDDHSTFVDACIDSSFRCLDATTVLLSYSDIPPFLFLVVNTTLVSALVLVLACFGDYDKHFPLQDGLDKAETFLQHQAASDPQAAQYLRYVRSLRVATDEYCRSRSIAEMKRRGDQVCAIFGAVDRNSYSYLKGDEADALTTKCVSVVTDDGWLDELENAWNHVEVVQNFQDMNSLDAFANAEP